jgi:hypothetical protein
VLLQFGERARPAPIAIGTVVSWYSSTRPKRVSDLAKSGPPWTRTVPSSSRAFSSAIVCDQIAAEDLGRSPFRLLQTCARRQPSASRSSRLRSGPRTLPSAAP